MDSKLVKSDKTLVSATLGVVSAYAVYRLTSHCYARRRRSLRDAFYSPFGLLTPEYGDVDTPGLPIGHQALRSNGPIEIHGSYVRDDEKRLATFPGPYPDGWYRICNVDEIPAGADTRLGAFDCNVRSKPLSVTALGEQFVIFRNPKTGEIGVLEAYCPHFGAHLGGGEVTEDGCLKCPFHAWKFDTKGGCVDIESMPPLQSSGKRPLPKGQVAKSYPVRVIADMVFIWFAKQQAQEPHQVARRSTVADEPPWDIQFHFRKYETSGSCSPFKMISKEHNLAGKKGSDTHRDDPGLFTWDTKSGWTECGLPGEGDGASFGGPSDDAQRPLRPRPVPVDTYTDSSSLPPDGKDKLVEQINSIRVASRADPAHEARLRDELYRTDLTPQQYQANAAKMLQERKIRLVRTTRAPFAMHLVEPSMNSADFFHFKTMHEALPIPFIGHLVQVNYYVTPEYFAPLPHTSRFDSVGASTHFKFPGPLGNSSSLIGRLLRTAGKWKLVNKYVGLTVVTFEGPGIIHFTLETPWGNVYLFKTYLPLRPGLLDMQAKWYADSTVPWLMAWMLAEVGRGALNQDRPVWENKIYLKRPNLVRGDGPFRQHAKWWAGFYSDPSDA